MPHVEIKRLYALNEHGYPCWARVVFYDADKGTRIATMTGKIGTPSQEGHYRAKVAATNVNYEIETPGATVEAVLVDSEPKWLKSREKQV